MPFPFPALLPVPAKSGLNFPAFSGLPFRTRVPMQIPELCRSACSTSSLKANKYRSTVPVCHFSKTARAERTAGAPLPSYFSGSPARLPPLSSQRQNQSIWPRHPGEVSYYPDWYRGEGTLFRAISVDHASMVPAAQAFPPAEILPVFPPAATP